MSNDKNLISTNFVIDSQNFLRYKSAKQVNIQTGSLMKDYINTLNNLFSLHSTELPNLPYTDWLNWAHINGKTNKNKTKYLFIITSLPNNTCGTFF